jgi:hypothetical protein
VLATPDAARRLGPPTRGFQPADPAAAILLRLLPFPSTDAEVEAALGRVGCGGPEERLAIEQVALAGCPAGDAALRDLAKRARAGELGAAAGCAIASARSGRESCASADDLFEDSLRPEPDLAHFSRLAFDRVVLRELAARRFVAAGELHARLAARHPGQPDLRIDAAAAFLRAGDVPRAEPSLASLAREAAAPATTDQVRGGTARLGLAWVALVRGDARGAAGLADSIRRDGRAPQAHEDALHALHLRAEIVRAIAIEAQGIDATGDLEAALARAPIDVERCFVDDAWYGAFGPSFGAELLAGSALHEPLLSTAIALCRLLDAEGEAHGYGLSVTAESEDESDERLASALFLTVAEGLLLERGDPAAAISFLEPRVASLSRKQGFALRQREAEALLLEFRCRLYANDAQGAERAVDAAGRIAAELSRTLERDWLQRLAEQESPAPPASRLVGRIDAPMSSLVTRVLLSRSNLKATLRGDAIGAAEDLFEAGRTWPWEPMRWLKCALDFARRDRDDDARRCLARVERSVDLAYDRACVLAQLGEDSAAIELLHEHLGGIPRTAAGRALEVRFMQSDLDLRPVREHPSFPRE